MAGQRKNRQLSILGDIMNRRTFGYALFVVIMIVILTAMPFLVGKVDPIYLLLIVIALGLLWPIVRIYTRRTSQLNREENVGT